MFTSDFHINFIYNKKNSNECTLSIFLTLSRKVEESVSSSNNITPERYLKYSGLPLDVL